MNKAKLKTYAPQARKDFIAAVTARAHRIGLAEKNDSVVVAPAEKNGDFVIIAGQSWPAKISRQRDNLIARIDKEGFSQTIEAVAYTWFNRFAALRYMEIHDYLSHGYRVLSSREGGLPEILNAAPELAQSRELPDLNPQQVIDLKLVGDQDGELFRLTLIAQCNALSKVMPFLFERIDNETELLLPDNLLLTDSVIAKLVEAIPEEDWQEVEIIGWLYQFYISEKKDQVIGKVVKSEDIPAATQLFTPNWIVQYLVQNSVGRLWSMANPTSTLKSQWPYYIEPAEQTPEVQTQLDALIKTRMAEDGGSLNPESITVLDPACGSGHILVEAYEILKAIYLERGYQPRIIPRLILEKNLFGLDIDDRAAQLAGFALLMKARADDRRLFNELPKLNVYSIQSSKNLQLPKLWQQLDLNRQSKLGTTSSLFEEPQTDLSQVIDDSHYQLIKNTLALFEQAKTLGSLIQVPTKHTEALQDLLTQLHALATKGDSFQRNAAASLMPFIRQAIILAMQFDAVVANPPYMGGKGMNSEVKNFAKRIFPDSKSDLFAMFIERGFGWCKQSGFNSMVTMQSWMFLSSYESMRQKLLREHTLSCMVHMGNGVMGIAFGTVATIFFNQHVNEYAGSFSYCDNDDLTEEGIPTQFPVQNERLKTTKPDDFKKIPGSPVAYWVPKKLLDVYSSIPQLYESTISDGQNITADNAKYVRFLWEIDCCKFGKKKKWIYYAKGGPFKRWFGNNDYVVDWNNEARLFYRENSSARIIPQYLWFKPGITWTLITSSRVSFRLLHKDGTFDKTGSSVFMREVSEINPTLAFLNSCVSDYLIKIFSSTVALQVDEVRRLPFRPADWRSSKVVLNADELCAIAEKDWNLHETSRDFLQLGWASKSYSTKNISEAWAIWEKNCSEAISRMRLLEEENNNLFIEAYDLQYELSPEVPEAQITLARADRENDCQRLISYAIGCMMGRYSLDEPGLIYAHAGNIGFDPNRYNTFPADADGIVPITDELWFEEDAANRINEFLLAVWDAETLEENRAWLATSLGQKGNETPQETIRRYIAGSFYKNHLQTYKKRPIYWLFSSGKQGAFQALVYLHRYNESTLSRMRAEYVVPLTGKIQLRIEMLKKDAVVASSNAEKSKLDKDIDKLGKKYVELLSFDEKLRNYADLRIRLDLDDGVKVNYGKFGDLLADVRAVTGGKDE